MRTLLDLFPNGFCPYCMKEFLETLAPDQPIKKLLYLVNEESLRGYAEYILKCANSINIDSIELLEIAWKDWLVIPKNITPLQLEYGYTDVEHQDIYLIRKQRCVAASSSGLLISSAGQEFVTEYCRQFDLLP